MTQADTLFSLPGDWIDRTGRPRVRFDVNRIVVLKPDHIGDLLIAARGFELLRHFFPRAQIDLVCGPWNVELARKLSFFDNIHNVNLFHEVSESQSDPGLAVAARRRGVERLADLNLGPYDLAIDFRYDTDSRKILLNFDAKAYAGYGTVKEFPFLDIVVPMHFGHGVAESQDSVVVTGHNFHLTSGVITESLPESTGSGVIEADRKWIELDLLVKGCKSPADCGTVADDRRLLGIGLTQICIEGLTDDPSAAAAWRADLSPWHPSVTLLSGWGSVEDWGVWGIGATCRIRLALPPSRGEKRLRVGCALMGHVNTANPEVECTLRMSGSDQQDTAHFKQPRNRGALTLDIDRHSQRVRLASVPIRLRPGIHDGTVRVFLPKAVGGGKLLRLVVRGVESNARLAEATFGEPALARGVCNLPFTCRVETGDEPVSVEFEIDDAAAFAGARIELLTLAPSQPLKLNTPVAHMESLARMLALRVAMEFSDVPPFGQSTVIQQRLGALPLSDRSGVLQGMLERVQDWKRSGSCVVGIALGCNSEIRKWPHHYFVEIGRQLLELDVKLMFVGSRGEIGEALEACRQLDLDPEQHAVCGLLSLGDMGPLLQSLDMFLASNTGSVHYAGRMGVRTIGIYAGTNHPREWGPVGDNTSWIYRDEGCATCSLTRLKDCRFGHVCLHNLVPEQVAPLIIPEVLATLSRRAAAGALAAAALH